VAFLPRRRRSAGTIEPWNARGPGDPRVSFRAEFSKLRNYLDLLRSAVGSSAFAGGFGFEACIQAPDTGSRTAPYLVIGLRAAVLLVGVLVQTTRIERKRVTFFPPIFYLAGLSLGLCDPRAAGFAFIFMWALNPMFGNAQGLLTGYALSLAGFGFLFRAPAYWTSGYAAALVFLPVLLSLLAQRPLIVLSRKPARGDGSP
jgi:hypothetical protein